MITKNDDDVKLQSGNDFQVYYNSAWITLGNIVSGRLQRKASPKEIKYNNGYAFDKRTNAKANLSVVLAQVTKEIFDTIDQILTTGRKLYFHNGVNNNKAMEIYVEKSNLIENIDLSMEGDSHQTIGLEFSIVPQASNVSVIPSSGLPAGAASHGVNTLQTGFNPFYVILET